MVLLFCPGGFMQSSFKAFVFFLGCAILWGCASRQDEETASSLSRIERFRQSFESASRQEQASASQALVSKAHSAIGTPYVVGGSAPGGFDCSGLVSWAYKSVGVKLPRTAREQAIIGEKINDPDKIRAGDIVAFHHPKRGYHTGIYVGDGKFIHSPRKRTRVKINSLNDPYFNSTFLGARRVSLEDGTDLVAQAESRLIAYASERKLRKQSAAKKSLNAKSRLVRKFKGHKPVRAAKKSANREVAAKKSSKKTGALLAAKAYSAKSGLGSGKKLSNLEKAAAGTRRTGKMVASPAKKGKQKTVSVSSSKTRKVSAEKLRRRS